MSIFNGRQLHTWVWGELPIGDDIIYQVKELAAE